MMDGLRGWLKQLRALLHRGDVERELDAEIGFHLEMETSRLMREEGLAEAESRRRAVAAFGGERRWKEAVREARWVSVVDALLADVRYGLRSLRRNPGYAAAATLTLGLGIGATTAVFSVIESVLLRPLPYASPGELIVAGTADRGEAASAMPFALHAEYLAWSRSKETLESAGAYTMAGYRLTGGVEPMLADALVMDAGLLGTLGVSPWLGRGFSREHEVEGGPRVALLSHAHWRTNFGGDRGVVGRTVELNGEAFEVLGVLPEGFSFPPPMRRAEGWWTFEPAVYVPFGAIAEEIAYYPIFVVGRLAAGATGAQALGELSALAAAEAWRAAGAPERDVHIVGLQEAVVGPLRPALAAFLGAVALVLLIACVNLGALMLARLSARERELEVRTALGASRRRITRQLVTESGVVVVLGGAAGVVVATIGLLALVAAAPAGLPGVAEAGLNGRVMLFALVATAAAGVLVAILPALRAGAAGTGRAARGERGGVSARGTRRAHTVLVTGQVALAAALLIAAGLLIRSFGVLASVDPGFRGESLLTVDVASPHAERSDVLGYHAEVERRLATVPGVVAVSGVDRLPFGASSSRVPVHPGASAVPSGGASPVALNLTARPGYFEAMGIPLVEGRGFEAGERLDGPPSVVVSRSLAERLWPDGDAVGSRVTAFGTTLDVVGVAGDVRHFGPAVAPEPMIYFSHATDPVIRRSITVVVRTRSASATLAARVRSEVRAVDPSVAVSEVRSFSELRAGKVEGERFNALVVAVFGGLGLLLVAVGIYGVMAFAVQHRTREIGLRVALGATGGRVLAQFLGEAGRLVGVGLVVGLLAAMPIASLLQGMLYGIEPLDPAAFMGAAAAIALVGLLAAWLPARRAAGLDPLTALREE
jgi:putative ABC transport system permease protein